MGRARNTDSRLMVYSDLMCGQEERQATSTTKHPGGGDFGGRLSWGYSARDLNTADGNYNGRLFPEPRRPQKPHVTASIRKINARGICRIQAPLAEPQANNPIKTY